MTPTPATTERAPEALKQQATTLKLHGLLAHWDELTDTQLAWVEQWLQWVLLPRMKQILEHSRPLPSRWMCTAKGVAASKPIKRASSSHDASTLTSAGASMPAPLAPASMSGARHTARSSAGSATASTSRSTRGPRA